MSIECQVCCGDFKENQTVTCLHCKWIACTKCCQTYLCLEPVAQCMSCKHPWDDQFLRTTFPTAWIEKQYKAHKKDSIIAQEKSLLAESMPFVQSYKIYLLHKSQTSTIAEDKLKVKSLDKRITNTMAQITKLSYERSKEANAKRAETLDIYSSLVRERDHLKDSIRQRQWSSNRALNNYRYASQLRNTSNSSDLESDKKKYNHPCIQKDCRGFLDEKWTCGVCNKSVCKLCRTTKESNHVCNPDVLATVKAILDDSCPCPKCHEPISRTFGCDHMWCTFCNTGFSYKTGQVISNANNTNPYFLRWADSTSQTQGTHGLRQACADRMTLLNTVRQRVSSYKPDLPSHWSSMTMYECFERLVYSVSSIIQECNVTIPNAYDPIINRDARVKYLAGEYDEKQLASAALKQYKKHEYDTSFKQLQQLLHVTLTDWIAQMNESLLPVVKFEPSYDIFAQAITQQPARLITYFNEQSHLLAQQYAYSVYPNYLNRLYVAREEDGTYDEASFSEPEAFVIAWQRHSCRIRRAQ